jgi:hypothetical protein
MTQGAPTDILDLDALLTSRSLKPCKVRLGGRTWTVKRDFTAAQVVQYWSLVNTRKKDVEAFAMLVGEKDAPDFTAMIQALPVETAAPILRTIYKSAGLLKRDSAEEKDSAEEQAGESSAS